MGKARKWIIQFLIGRKEKETEKNSGNNQEHSSINNEIPTHTPTPTPTIPMVIPPPTPSKEKRRWSFRRSSATAPSQNGKNSMDSSSTTLTLQHAFLNSENDQKKLAMAAKATASMSQFNVATASGRTISIEDSAAIKIQSFFRAYLARKALNALRGLVKLQALVRGHLVRKQVVSTLRCLQALVTVQDRSRGQRLQLLPDSKLNYPKHFNHRKPTKDNSYRHSNQEFDWGTEQNVKVVEMDTEFKGCTKSRNSYSNHGQTEPRISSTHRVFSWHENQQISPTVSARTDMSPKTWSGHFEDYTLGDSFEYPFHPNYMANTKSSKAKVRSQSAPKQRHETPERQQTRRNNVPRAVKMQRSSSHVGSAPQTSCYPWSVKLDRSNISLKDSECGSNSTVLSNTNYCRSLVGFEVHSRT